MGEYLFRVGIAVSILINVILGGRSNQTFSARNYQRKIDHKTNIVYLIDMILGKDHCMMCWARWKVTQTK